MRTGCPMSVSSSSSTSSSIEPDRIKISVDWSGDRFSKRKDRWVSALDLTSNSYPHKLTIFIRDHMNPSFSYSNLDMFYEDREQCRRCVKSISFPASKVKELSLQARIFHYHPEDVSINPSEEDDFDKRNSEQPLRRIVQQDCVVNIFSPFSFKNDVSYRLQIFSNKLSMFARLIAESDIRPANPHIVTGISVLQEMSESLST